MEKLIIECASFNTKSEYQDFHLKLELSHVGNSFITELKESDIVANCNSPEELFNELMSFDDSAEILHSYLQKSGYIFNKE